MPLLTKPIRLAEQYEHIFKNHDDDIPRLPFDEFVHCCEREEITPDELEDTEFMCDRVDVWSDNLGILPLGTPNVEADKPARMHDNVNIDEVLKHYAGIISYDHPGYFEIAYKGRAYLIGTVNGVWEYQWYDIKKDPHCGNPSPQSVNCLDLSADTDDLIQFIDYYIFCDA